MQTIATIRFDSAKSAFRFMASVQRAMWLFAANSSDDMFWRYFKKLPSCLVGVGVCASSHYWSRELQALGRTVRLMALAYFNPYVKTTERWPPP